MTEVLRTLVSGRTLLPMEAEEVMERMLFGDLPSEQIAAMLIAMRMRGETPSEILGFVRALRRHIVAFPTVENAIDTCGTGGDGAGTFNISTASALLLAGCGLKIAKHGNRSISSRCGSADVLESLGVSLTLTPEKSARALNDHGFCFLFAPHYHPMLAKVKSIRSALGVPTIFNLLGPLLNPAKVSRQILGVSDVKLIVPFAELLRDLGTTEALVVSSRDGLDEISLSERTEVAHLKDGEIERKSFSAEDFGLNAVTREDLQGGEAAVNAEIIADILSGRETGPKRDVVLANSAAALYLTGHATTLREGVSLAHGAIQNGKAKAALEAVRSLS